MGRAGIGREAAEGSVDVCPATGKGPIAREGPVAEGASAIGGTMPATAGTNAATSLAGGITPRPAKMEYSNHDEENSYCNRNSGLCMIYFNVQTYVRIPNN